MKEERGAGPRTEPTFVDVLEHIGSGGVSVERLDSRHGVRREQIAAKTYDADRRREDRRARPDRE